jgi:multidrug resistance efflux pump
MSRRAQALVAAIIVIGVLAVGGVAGYFGWQNHLYVQTDDASVAGNVVNIYPTANGTLTAWNVSMGQHVTAGTVLGTIQVNTPAPATTSSPSPSPSPSPSAGTREQQPASFDVQLKAPANGLVVQSSGFAGQQVLAGSTPLAAVVDPGSVWILAYVNEGDVHRLSNGQRVDVHVDATPDVNYGGSVDVVDLATQSTFSALPNLSSGSFTKVTQRVPVRIKLDANPGALPVGGSAEVTIHVS